MDTLQWKKCANKSENSYRKPIKGSSTRPLEMVAFTEPLQVFTLAHLFVIEWETCFNLVNIISPDLENESDIVKQTRRHKSNQKQWKMLMP